MKLSKKISLLILVLSFVMFLNGCSNFSGLFSENSTEQSKAGDKKTSPKQKENLENKVISDLKKEIAEAKENYTKEQERCNEMKRVSEENKKDYQDPKSRTSIQCKKAEKIKNELEKANANLKNEEQKLNQTNESLPESSVSQVEASGSYEWLMWLLIGLAGLLLVGLISFLIWRLVLSPIRILQSEVEIINQNLAKLNDYGRKSKNTILQLKKTAEVLSRQFSEQQTAVSAIKRQVNKTSESQNFQTAQEFAEPIVKQEPIFPTSAENYINKIKQNSIKITVDPLTGFLIKDESKGDEFWLVDDDSLSEGLFYAIPNVFRFSKKGDYLSYYQNFYACDYPTGGTVWIKSPTIVQSIPDGWKLYEMGELEIR